MVTIEVTDKEFDLIIYHLHERRLNVCDMIEYDGYDMSWEEMATLKKSIEELDLIETKFRRKRMGEEDKEIFETDPCLGCKLECRLHNWC